MNFDLQFLIMLVFWLHIVTLARCYYNKLPIQDFQFLVIALAYPPAFGWASQAMHAEVVESVWLWGIGWMMLIVVPYIFMNCWDLFQNMQHRLSSEEAVDTTIS